MDMLCVAEIVCPRRGVFLGTVIMHVMWPKTKDLFRRFEAWSTNFLSGLSEPEYAPQAIEVTWLGNSFTWVKSQKKF